MTPSSNFFSQQSMLVLDASYTLEMIQGLGIESSITCRDLDGFFRHVWTVHPFATLLTSETWSPRYGKPVWHDLGSRHHFIEGKVGRFGWLSFFFPANFLIGQIGLFFTLWSLIRREDIRVIRVGDPLYLGMFGLALSRLTGIPLIIRVNGNNDRLRKDTGAPLFPRLFRSERVERVIERFVFPRAEMVAAPNPDNIEFALSAGAQKEVTTIFRYGNLLAAEHLVEPGERGLDHVLLAKLGIEQGKFLLSVGRLEPLKFPEDCVHTLSELRKRGYDLKLIFAGEGKLKSSLREQAERLGVTEWVIFAGNQTQLELAQLNTHSAVVLSPLTGRALSESGLGASAIVAYDLDWQSELIENDKTGFLIPFRDKDRFVDAVEKIIINPSLKHRMGTAVRERALSILDPERLNEHERCEYRRILGLG